MVRRCSANWLSSDGLRKITGPPCGPTPFTAVSFAPLVSSLAQMIMRARREIGYNEAGGCMSLTIPEETLDGLRHAARDALIDMACRLYDAERISKSEGTKLTGLSRVEFE